MLRPGLWRPSYNLAPSNPALLLRSSGGQRVLEPMRWGLGGRIINLRAENLPQTRWGRLMREGLRCLVPASGFYEWAKPSAQPYFFRPANAEVLAMAGVYDPAGESFALITTPANPTVSPIHSRMPAIIDPAHYESWLSPATPWPTAHQLLGPAPAQALTCQPASRRLNRPGADGPELLNPEGYQPRLL